MRDFKGVDNDKIQELFLKSLQDQSYKNFELIITIFKEKNVENTINKFNLPVRFFYCPSGDYKYSHTEVLLNCIKTARSNLENCIIIWSTADVIFENNFFEFINGNLPKYAVATSHPHIIYRSINDFITGEKPLLSLGTGMDVVIFDGLFFSNEEVVNDIESYKNINWGLFEHFLSALAYLYAEHRINFYYQIKIKKIVNDLKNLNENVPKQDNYNIVSFKNFLKDKKLSYNFFYLFWCNLVFDLHNSSRLRYYWDFKRYFITKDFLFSLIPKKLKILIKKQ
ncbi:MAG: hypothetical protein ACP5H7_02915 [Minisyncoccia bacterium]